MSPLCSTTCCCYWVIIDAWVLCSDAWRSCSHAWGLFLDVWGSCSDAWRSCSDAWWLCSDVWGSCSDAWGLCSHAWGLCLDVWGLCSDAWRLCSDAWGLCSAALELCVTEEPTQKSLSCPINIYCEQLPIPTMYPTITLQCQLAANGLNISSMKSVDSLIPRRRKEEKNQTPDRTMDAP